MWDNKRSSNNNISTFVFYLLLEMLDNLHLVIVNPLCYIYRQIFARRESALQSVSFVIIVSSQLESFSFPFRINEISSSISIPSYFTEMLSKSIAVLQHLGQLKIGFKTTNQDSPCYLSLLLKASATWSFLRICISLRIITLYLWNNN